MLRTQREGGHGKPFDSCRMTGPYRYHDRVRIQPLVQHHKSVDWIEADVLRRQDPGGQGPRG